MRCNCPFQISLAQILIMTPQQSIRCTKLKTNHLSSIHIFTEIEGGLLNTLLSNLCVSEIYNLSISLPSAGRDYFDGDSNSVLPHCCLRQHFYRKAKVQVQKAITSLQPEILSPMQVATKSFGEGSILLLIDRVQLCQIYVF